ncbi:hypothetical protein [Rhodococcus koreensis]
MSDMQALEAALDAAMEAAQAILRHSSDPSEHSAARAALSSIEDAQTAILAVAACEAANAEDDAEVDEAPGWRAVMRRAGTDRTESLVVYAIAEEQARQNAADMYGPRFYIESIERV